MCTTTRPRPPGARLGMALARASAENRAALVTFLPVGFPTLPESLDALRALADHADVIEIGLPHTNAHLDGPVIRQAAAQALQNGFRMRDLFAATAMLSTVTDTAVLVMSYWSPIARYGAARFTAELGAAGGAGVLVPDLPEPHAASWQTTAQTAGLHPIPLIPPHASAAELSAIGAAASGLVYAPATPGLTGARRPLSPYLPRLVRRVRTHTGLPVAVGIGISNPDQAAQASAYSDAVVVGSALIRGMQAAPAAPAAAAAERAAAFAAGVRRVRRPPA